MNLTDLLHPVKDIAREAGAAILDIYARAEGIVIEKKADDSPLTIADQTANRIICDRLEKLPRVFPIISEENRQVAYEIRQKYTHNWLVDPLDGTKEFIKRNGEFTVNIALVQGGKPVLGVVYAPVPDELYWAAAGHGAFLEKNGQTQRLAAAKFDWSEPGLKVVCSRSHLNAETSAFIETLREPELVSKGSSLKFLILAKGDAHIYPRLAPTMEWDTGAAQIILEEAGGKVLQWENRKPVTYNKPDLLNPHFIAFGQAL
ncbi:MAG: 3'(2'),5'-bisphosphate nucleotidase [Bacteroidetes bacterium]|nr:MAG: 3'(2'),5'-bisphosphate nucleotidase [Bacteroidota bacterium]